MGDGYGGASGGPNVQNQNIQQMPQFGPQSVQALKGAAQSQGGGDFSGQPLQPAGSLGAMDSAFNLGIGGGGGGGSAGLLRSTLQGMNSGAVGGSGGVISGGAASMPGGIGGALL